MCHNKVKDGRAGGGRYYLSNWLERQNFGGQGLGSYKTLCSKQKHLNNKRTAVMGKWEEILVVIMMSFKGWVESC